MRDRTEDTPFPLPPREGALECFPDTVPWNTPIFEMSNWWLSIYCNCGGSNMPLRLLAARIGWRRTLRTVVPHLVCRKCRQRPTNVQLVDDPGGDHGRFGAKTRRLQLMP